MLFERLNGMQILLFLIFIAVPIIEIALFIEAGRTIGLALTIAITIGTAIAGSFLMRVQGFATLRRFSEAVQNNEMPITPVVDGIGILTAGLLLLTPGLFTDAIGLLLFVPPFRRGLANWVFRQTMKGGKVHFRYSDSGVKGGPRQERPRSEPVFKKSDKVIDAEFETIAPEEESDSPGMDRQDSKGNSPWRPK